MFIPTPDVSPKYFGPHIIQVVFRKIIGCRVLLMGELNVRYLGAMILYEKLKVLNIRLVHIYNI